MKIGRVVASRHLVRVLVPLLDEPRGVPVIVVRADSDDGAVGYGVAGPQHQGSVIELINREVGPFLVGRDPLLSEHVAHDLLAAVANGHGWRCMRGSGGWPRACTSGRRTWVMACCN